MRKLRIGGTAHELAEELITIGRAPENIIRIDDPSVSSRHAELRLQGEEYRLHDVGSTNGTRVNGVSVTETQLRAGDRIRLGKAEVCYECEELPASQPLPPEENLEARPAEFTARPVDFANASPFPNRKKQRDRARTAIFGAAIAAFVAFAISMAGVLLMRTPSP